MEKEVLEKQQVCKTEEKFIEVCKEQTASCVIERPNYDNIPEVNLPEELPVEDQNVSKGSLKSKFRVKLVGILTCLGLAITSGWVIGNAIHLNNVNNSIQQTQYEINQVQLIIKEAQLDNAQDVKNDKSVVNTIVNTEPKPLANPVKTAPQTNWFDRFCDWLGGIFGG